MANSTLTPERLSEINAWRKKTHSTFAKTAEHFNVPQGTLWCHLGSKKAKKKPKQTKAVNKPQKFIDITHESPAESFAQKQGITVTTIRFAPGALTPELLKQLVTT